MAQNFFKVASVADIRLLVTKITFVVAQIIIREDLITSYVATLTFVVDEITFKVASVADISLFVASITFVVADIIIKKHVITFSVAKITYVVAEITLNVERWYSIRH